MKYTIIDGEKKTPFIQQQYDTLKEAEDRFAELQKKSAKHYPIVIVGVDETGAYVELPKEEPVTKEV